MIRWIMENEYAITIQQPWASLIMSGHKDVENRIWRPKRRGRIWIHAGKVWDPDGIKKYGSTGDLPIGAILGHVTLSDVVNDSTSPWALPDRWHWLLTDPRPLSEPIAARGRQSLWSCGILLGTTVPPQSSPRD